MIYKTGHFTCYEKRTFLLANDISGWAVTLPQCSTGICHLLQKPKPVIETQF